MPRPRKVGDPRLGNPGSATDLIGKFHEWKKVEFMLFC